jgi:hypothetical protein
MTDENNAAASPNGVFDNTANMRRERWIDGELVSSLPCTDEMRANPFFPWGCFADLSGLAGCFGPPETKGTQRHESG